MMEIVKNSDFANKLVFIVLSENDRVYYKKEQDLPIEAKVYSASDQAEYSKYWDREYKVLEKKIEEIGNPINAISQIKENKIIQKILLDLPDFIEFIRDHKGLSISEHEAENFRSIIAFINV